MDAISTSACLRIGTATGAPHSRGTSAASLALVHQPVADEPLAFLDAALKIANGVQPVKVDAELHERLRYFRGQARHDDERPQDPCGAAGLKDSSRHLGVDCSDARYVHDDHLPTSSTNGP